MYTYYNYNTPISILSKQTTLINIFVLKSLIVYKKIMKKIIYLIICMLLANVTWSQDLHLGSSAAILIKKQPQLVSSYLYIKTMQFIISVHFLTPMMGSFLHNYLDSKSLLKK